MQAANHHHPLPGMPFPPQPMRCIPCGQKQLDKAMQKEHPRADAVEEEDLSTEDVDAVLGVLEEEAEEEAVLDLLPFPWSSSKSNVAQLWMDIPPWMDPMTTMTMTDLGARSQLPSVLDERTLTTTETLGEEEEKEPKVTRRPVKMSKCWRVRRSAAHRGTVFKPRATRKTSPH